MSGPVQKKHKKSESNHKDSNGKDTKGTSARSSRNSDDKSQNNRKKTSKDDKKSSLHSDSSSKSEKPKNSPRNRQPTANSNKNAEKKASDNIKNRRASQVKEKSLSKRSKPQTTNNKRVSMIRQGSIQIGNPSGSDNEYESSTQDSQSYDYEDFSSDEVPEVEVDELSKTTFDAFFESIKSHSINNFQYHKMPDDISLIPASKNSTENRNPELMFSQQSEETGYKLTISTNEGKLVKKIDDNLLISDGIPIDIFNLSQNRNYNLSSIEAFDCLSPKMQISLAGLQNCFSDLHTVMKGLIEVSDQLTKMGTDDYSFEEEYKRIEKEYGKYENGKSSRQFAKLDFGDQIRSVLDV